MQESAQTSECLQLASKGLLFILSNRRDHAQLDKMRQLGMKPEDEFKLSMMREHISKLASSRHA